MLNRRGFLKRAAGMVGAVALGVSILPTEAKAKEIGKVDISAINNGEGGYIVPSQYTSELEDLIRRDYAEQIALSIDRAAIRGVSPFNPVILKNHKGSKAIGKVEKITIKGSRLLAKVRGIG